MSASTPLHYLPLNDLCARLRNGELTARTVSEYMLERIAALNPQLHCYNRLLAESALQRADELDAARRAGAEPGVLHGVPIGLKDLLDIKGVPTASGTVVMADQVAVTNATVVDKLHAAGAVVLGKLQLTEGAYGSHHPALTAPVNPWGEHLWPGVSSSGSGVSVAAGLAFATLGSDTGGSIRFPSAANGVVGIKPTYGRVSRAGAFPLAESLDHIGPLARSVADCARMLQAIAGHDPRDPNSLNAPVPDYLASAGTGLKGVRIGVDWRFVEQDVQPEVVAVVRQALAAAQAAGAVVREVTVPPEHAVLVRHWVVTCGVECALAHEHLFPQRRADYGPDLSRLIDLGRKTGGLQYAALERIRERFTRDFDALFNSIDMLICPAMPVLAPTNAAMERGAADDDSADAVQEEFGREFIAFTAPSDYSGHPTITLPVAVASGPPGAVQLIGPKLGEQQLIHAAGHLEQELDWVAPPLP